MTSVTYSYDGVQGTISSAVARHDTMQHCNMVLEGPTLKFVQGQGEKQKKYQKQWF